MAVVVPCMYVSIFQLFLFSSPIANDYVTMGISELLLTIIKIITNTILGALSIKKLQTNTNSMISGIMISYQPYKTI